MYRLKPTKIWHALAHAHIHTVHLKVFKYSFIVEGIECFVLWIDAIPHKCKIYSSSPVENILIIKTKIKHSIIFKMKNKIKTKWNIISINCKNSIKREEEKKRRREEMKKKKSSNNYIKRIVSGEILIEKKTIKIDSINAHN